MRGVRATNSIAGVAPASRAGGRPRRIRRKESMSKLIRALVAGYGAKKLGGGCFSTVLIFILLFWLLGRLF